MTALLAHFETLVVDAVDEIEEVEIVLLEVAAVVRMQKAILEEQKRRGETVID